MKGNGEREGKSRVLVSGKEEERNRHSQNRRKMKLKETAGKKKTSKETTAQKKQCPSGGRRYQGDLHGGEFA